MAIRLTRIYTRTGDECETHLGDGSRTSKSDPRLQAYADCDETNAVLGLVLALGSPTPRTTEIIRRVQNDLFDLGADLATPIGTERQATALRMIPAQVKQLEHWCDELNESLPTLTSFILPGGSPAGALLHQARTVSRRAERSAWVSTAGHDVNEVALQYLNRLSDLLFILARVENGGDDPLWVPGGESANRGDQLTDDS